MTIEEVKSNTQRHQFLDVARLIYQNDPNWVCPLDINIEAVFDPKKNNFHEHGQIKRWILKSEKGELIGRIAAFVNDKKAYQYEQPTGGVGFFECINDIEASSLLTATYRDENLRVNIASSGQQRILLTVCDILGRKTYEQIVILKTGYNDNEIYLPGLKGIYIVKAGNSSVKIVAE